MPNFQGVWSLSEQYQNAGIWPSPPITGLFMGRTNTYNSIEKIFFTTLGNATDVGDLSSEKLRGAAVGSTTRAVHAGGYNTTGDSRSNVIDFVTFASLGTASDFGDLTVSRSDCTSMGNATRGVWAGGSTGGSYLNTMDYITIASIGNATDFGDMGAAGAGLGGGDAVL